MNDGYASWRAVEQALKAAALKQQTRTQISVDRQLRGAYLDRVLCRVFDSPDADRWVLKGGGSMLARIPDARQTKDLDLSSTHNDLDTAEAALHDRLGRDLGDHLRVEAGPSRPIVAGRDQNDVDGRRIPIEVRSEDGRKRLLRFPIDLVVETHPLVGEIRTIEPANRLHLPRELPAAPYRLYPIVDQVADKVVAGMKLYAGRESTRVKDLADLVLISRTEQVDLAQLRTALSMRLRVAGLRESAGYQAPTSWNDTFRGIQTQTPALNDVPDAATALRIAKRFVDPAFSPTLSQPATWTPQHGWSPKSRSEARGPLAGPIVNPPESGGEGPSLA